MRITLVVIAALAAALGGCGENQHDSNATPMQTGTITHNPHRDQLREALTDAGWPSETIVSPNPTPDRDRIVADDPDVIDVTLWVDDHECALTMEYYPGKPPTYRLRRIAGKLLIEWTQLIPEQFNTPGISREKLRKKIRTAIKNGNVEC